MPSSPPVTLESCDARMAKNEATASVIMAKKIAFTRNENRPIRNESESDSAIAATVPSAIALQPASSRDSAMATP